MRIQHYTIAFIGALCSTLSAKVLIITHAYLRPDFIAIQDDTFKKFMQDEYEFVVFNDARHTSIKNKIKKICKERSLRCIDIPQAIHDKPYLYRMRHEDPNHPGPRCANVVQYSLDQIGFKHHGLVMIIDSDMFLIKPFSLAQCMQNIDIAGVPQSRGHVYYIWNGLVFFNMDTLPDKQQINFNCGIIDGQPLDVGGYLYPYLKSHPQLRTHYFGQIYPKDFACDSCKKKNIEACTHNSEVLKARGFDDATIAFIQAGPHNMEFFLERTFLHYRGGGNWDHKSPQYHAHKTAILNTFIKNILS